MRWRAMGYAPPWSTDFATACRSWSDHVRSAMDFEARRPDRCMTIRYEELVADPEGGLRDIYRFLGVFFEEAPISFIRSRRIQSSYWRQSPGKFIPRPDPWQEWTEEQRHIFLEEAGATMLRYSLVTDSELQQLEADAGRLTT